MRLKILVRLGEELHIACVSVGWLWVAVGYGALGVLERPSPLYVFGTISGELIEGREEKEKERKKASVRKTQLRIGLASP